VDNNLNGGPIADDDSTGTRDWINLPQGTNAISLWDCLHDADIVSISSNLLERTVSLVCQIEHLCAFHHMSEGLQFTLKLEGVAICASISPCHMARSILRSYWCFTWTRIESDCRVSGKMA